MVFILLSLAVGGLSGLLSAEGMDLYDATVVKPPLSPPPVLFPIVWSVLYILMGIGAARIWLSEAGSDRSKALNLFVAQLAVNFFWSIIFFNLQAFGFAFFWLLVLLVLVVY